MGLFPPKIQDKFTSNLKSVINNAENISREFNHNYIGIEHIIYGIISQKGSIGSNVLGMDKVNLKNLHDVIDVIPKAKKWKPVLSGELKNIFKKTVLIASKYKHSYIGTEHLLYAILVTNDKKTMDLFSGVGIKAETLLQQLKALLESSARFTDIVDLFDQTVKIQKINPGQIFPGPQGMNGFMMDMPNFRDQMSQKQSALECFCIDLIKSFEEKKTDPIIGREEEVGKVINILNRKTKNNPVLVGEPGVGKTAIVQGLAQRIFEGKVPVNLLNKRIYSLDVGLLVAGAVFRGEFEARLKDVIAEAQENPNVILFIDEIHTIIGAGSASGSGSLDAANILKPPLSRGDISCIGATTLDEYRKHFKKDAALERRFQMVLVEEPSVAETKKMLRGLKGLYEKHHNLLISEEAVDMAVELSERFLSERFLPDKAFDVLDEASALVRSRNTGKNYFGKIKILEAKKRAIQLEKEKAIDEEKYDEALLIKDKEGDTERKVIELYKLQDEENKKGSKTPVTADDISDVITRITGIPVKKMVSKERERLKDLEGKLKKFIIGQDEAISVISKSVRRARLGISSENRPLGVFMFLGPTGVGKTELAKVLAKVIYENQDALIKVDMSEFMERHNVSRLVGAPAGYVGYEEGGQLTEKVRLHPYSVILFDEVEKAHPDVFNLLLQIFEDGELTDAAGRKVNFKNTVIIMTSNIGTEEMTEEAKIGFSNTSDVNDDEKKEKIRKKYIDTKDSIIKELKGEFRPEFINRLDSVIIFDPLGKKDINSITKMQFEDLAKRIERTNGIKIKATKKALDYVAAKSFDPNEGARLVRRNLQSMAEDMISQELVGGNVERGDIVVLDLEKGKIVLKKKK